MITKIYRKQFLFYFLICMMHTTFATIPNSITGNVTGSFSHPYGIALLPNDTMAYVCNSSNNSVNFFNVETNTVVGTVTDTNHTFNKPTVIAITPNGTTAYICNQNGNSVSIINIATNTVTGIVNDPLVTLDKPLAIAITPDGTKAYVCNQNNNSISIIDLVPTSITYNTVTGTVNDPNSTLGSPYAIAITPNGSTAYVCNYIRNSVSIINIATDTVTGTVTNTSYTFNEPNAIGITPDGTTAYVSNFGNYLIIIINIATNTTIGSLNCPLADPSTIAIMPNGIAAYVCDENSIVIIDVAANKITGTVLSSSFNIPIGIAITSNNETGYITNELANSVSILYIATPVQAPSSISVKRGIDRFLQFVDIINTISWTPPTQGTSPVEYAIYRDAALTQLITTVSASGPLSYSDSKLSPNTTYHYYIVSIDAQGNVSAPISTSIKG